MRTILSTIALFSFLCITAQEYSDPSVTGAGLERPRETTIPYPTVAEAAAAAGESKYMHRIDWQKEDTRQGTYFTAEYTVPFTWANRQVLLRIASAPGPYEVKVNDRIVGYSQNGTLPAEYNVSKASSEGKNFITVTLVDDTGSSSLESWEHAPEEMPGNAFVISQPTVRLRDIFINTRKAGEGFTAEVGMVVKTDALNPKTARIHYELRDTSDRVVKSGFQDITLSMRREDTLRFVTAVPQEMLWSAESPLLYDLTLKTQIEGRYAEYLAFRIGFRSEAVDENGRLLLNGTLRELRTAEIRPDLPVAELAAMKTQGVNTLKLRPGIVREGFYDDCDSIGLYVIAQAPIDTSASGVSIRKGGNPSNQPVWKNAYLERTEGVFYIVKRHPSVIALSLAENSANGINLYESYLNLKARESSLPIVYPAAAGQWNSDNLLLEPITTIE